MENLEQILSNWEKDANIDETEPSREIIRVPILHSKYLTNLTKHRIAVKKLTFDLYRMRKIKWEYYSGKMSEEDLQEHGWEPFRYTLKSDISTYLEADSDIIKIQEKKAYHEEVVEVCVAIIKELANRTWQLREHMTHERFIQGAR